MYSTSLSIEMLIYIPVAAVISVRVGPFAQGSSPLETNDVNVFIMDIPVLWHGELNLPESNIEAIPVVGRRLGLRAYL